ncbi:MAG: AAA family ATPase [Gemmatimonadota bacterium]|nr:AAA family ATPase [Gemmatimonadota bacterium]MDE2984000.1 AAA family ATPase [Gemmatimonadota bacterium]
MRFESIRVARYGCLADLSTGDSPLPSIVVVLGPNESGKSTLFDFLSTLLYGFRPATRDRHPFTPWTGGNPEGWARLRMNDGTAHEIHRRLLSTGRGRLTVDGRHESIDNRPVPGAEHVKRVVFRQVFALTLSELAGLQRESWELVQDRLVGAMAAPDLRSARRVADELEAEAAGLWRPDRRGRPVARILRDELRTLNDRLRDAMERDRELREKVARMARAEADLEALREERARERERRGVMEYRLNRLLPVRRALGRIEELRREAGRAEELAGLVADPGARLEELRRAVRGGGEGVDDAVAFADGESDDARARLAEQGGRLFSVPWDEIDHERLLTVSVDDLRDMVNVYRRKREQRRIAEEGLREESLSGLRQVAPSGRWRLASGLAGLLAGGGAAAVARWFPGLLRPVPAVEMSPGIVFRAGLTVAALGLLGLILWLDTLRHRRRYRKAFESAERGRRTELMGLTESEDVARRAVAQSLNGLPVRNSLLRDPDHDLPAAFEKLAVALADRRNRDRAARRELERTANRMEAAESGQDAAEVELAELEDRLRGLGNGDAERGAQSVRRRREALDRARQLRDELEREHPALAEIEGEIRAADEAGERWESLVDSLDAAAVRRDERNRQAEKLQGEIGTLHSGIRYLQEGETADRLAGRIEALKVRIRDAEESRDRAFVLARIVREADRRFRDNRQPDLLLRAATHLRYITRGRYDGIELGGPGDESLYLGGPAASEPRQVGQSLSQGTREQVYMALRLAIIDQLDADAETLPLFMDEILVNWDAWRRDRAFELLERVAEDRQVFLFTCHPAMAAELEDRGARVIALGVSG